MILCLTQFKYFNSLTKKISSCVRQNRFIINFKVISPSLKALETINSIIQIMERPEPTNDNPIDMSDLQQQRKILFALVGDLQKSQPSQKVQIIYDPLMGVSRLFAMNKEPEVIVKEEKKTTSVLQSVKKFITSCTSSCKSDKSGENLFSIRSVLFNALKVQEFDWLQRHYKTYDQKQLGNIKQTFLIVMKKSLSKIRFDIEQDRVDQQTKQSALNCIQQLEKVYQKVEPNKKSKFKFTLSWQKDYVFMIMISGYKAFQTQYSPYKRTKLKHLFKQLEKQAVSFNNSIEVLRFLQNKDSLLGKLMPISQLNLNSEVNTAVDNYLRDNKMAQIKTTIALVKVSDSFKRRRVVNLLISGFLSQDVDKKQQWNQLLACMPDSQVYGLQWESNTINRLVKFLALSIKDVILGKDLNALLTKDNPFIPAFEVAIQAGQMLAYVVHKLFPFQFINIISYSLGSQLIRAFVDKTVQLNGGANLNKIISLGGVSDVDQFSKTLQKAKITINILNVRTKHDSVLKYILKRAKPNVKPLGLNDIMQNVGNHLISNLDVTSKIKGHFSFMTNFGTIAQILKLNEE